MRVSFEWLSRLIDLDISVKELADKMTMSGIAVEEIEDQAAKYEGIVTAKVLSLDKHQQADNLLIVKADAGLWGVKQIITAAKNLAIGNLVPLALSGAILPDGKKIDEVNFKGVLSQGMFCSGAELGLEKESTGIWIFTDHSIKLGISVAEALGETDQVLVLELTANRPDCLGMIGVAREVAAILDKKFMEKPITLKEEGHSVEQQAKVEIVDVDLCPRYAARVVNGVKIGPSPRWIQQRLKAAGVRPINNIVDITNYVMLEYNQPLHAFDLDHIAEHHIKVRRAAAAEKLVTLDDIERELTPENLLIADPQNGLCVAGVMGGCTSEITDQTQNMLLEAAYFSPSSIRRTAKQLAMKTEAAIRFERGIDPNGVLKALNRAAQLVEELGAGKVAKGYLDQYPKVISPVTIHTSASRINEWLGTNIPGAKIKDYLERVTFEVKVEAHDNIEVTIPTYRQDVTYMADLAEEVARLYGYNNITATIPESTMIGSLTSFQKMQQNCRKLLQGIGVSEVMTYSLYAATAAERLGIASLDSLANTIHLMVPLNEEQAVMRTNLVHHLLEVLAFNTRRRQSDISVYEIARVYWPKSGETLPEEPLHLGIALMGRKREIGWNQSREEVDFFDAKGIVELIFERLRLPEIILKPSTQPFFHPGQSADIYLNRKMVGFFGQIHPNIGTRYELNKRAFFIELDLSSLDERRMTDIIRFEPLPKFPAVQRDLALVVSTEITAQAIIAKIQEIIGDLVEKVDLFDVYQGEQVEKGRRSLAFSITYRSKERTLNDNEVNELQQKLLANLHQEYGALVRG
ncbi:MAG TPA: phenylalanine--tRNA ligase subunit beta [Firmicutes bacterium]|jgi:phenylalanyl-tRNA synthetase beta chain|nr:phenylalanine--tRNA ligase subunit beta [Bacillota bacterium]